LRANPTEDYAMPLTVAQLDAFVAQASQAIQAIQDDQSRQINERAKIRFPRGWIRTAGTFRTRYWYVGRTTQQNLGYAHITLDVFRWLVVRTDLAGIARDMIFKESICLIGSIVEALCSHITRGRIGKRHKFKERTARMLDAGMIQQATKDEVDWLWDLRGGVHIDELPNSEIDAYDVTDVNRALRALDALHADLQAYCVMS
jgi:hypothetical protein